MRLNQVYPAQDDSGKRASVSKLAANCAKRSKGLLSKFSEEGANPYSIVEELERLVVLGDIWAALGAAGLSSDQLDALVNAIEVVGRVVVEVRSDIAKFKYEVGRVTENTEKLKAGLIQLEKVHAQIYAHSVVVNGECISWSENSQGAKAISGVESRLDALQSRVDEANRDLGSTVQKEVSLAIDELVQGRLSDTLQKLSEAKDEYGFSQRKLEATNQSLAQIAKTAGEILDTAKEAGVVSTIGKHANEFQKLADDAFKLARNWLVTGIVSGSLAVTLLLVFGFVETISKDKFDSLHVLQLVVPRVGLAAGLALGSLYAFRLHRIYSHQAEVYKLRKTILTSAYRLYEASDDGDYKAAMLSEAAKTIFSAMPTGLIDADEENAEKRVMELLRSIRP